MSCGSWSSRCRKLSSTPHRARRTESARQFRGTHRARQLQQRERVPARLGDEPLADVIVEPAGDDRGQQRARVVVVEPGELELGQTRKPVRFTHREHHRDGLGEQPAGDEPEHLRGGLVEPLQVVDDAQQRLRLGHLRQERERGETDEEAVRCRAGRETERDLQRLLLRCGEHVEVVQQRPVELVQPRERQLHLGLDARDLQHPEVAGLADDVVQQRALADARFAPQHQHPAAGGARVDQQPVQRLPFAGAASERRRARSGGGHGAANLPVAGRPGTSPGATRVRTRELVLINHVPPEATMTTQTQTTVEAPITATVDYKLEVAVIPVSDVDRAKAFYAGLGWREDADFQIRDDFRVLQFTPTGSLASIIFGDGVTGAQPGSGAPLLLAVSDIDAARADLIARGVDVSDVFHSSAFDHNGEREYGPDPERKSYSTFAEFSDPDGNAWILQELTDRLPGR